MISIKSKGDFKKTRSFLKNSRRLNLESILQKYGELGVKALSENTPVDSGIMADSWGYDIEIKRNESIIYWYNSKINKGVNITLVLDYGHATSNGGYVEGRNFITPTMEPFFEEIKATAWEEIRNA